jgi:hypothetical protein
MKPDPLYDGIRKLRRQNRRRLISVALLILGVLLLAAAFWWRSAWLAIIGVATMVVAK